MFRKETLRKGKSLEKDDTERLFIITYIDLLD